MAPKVARAKTAFLFFQADHLGSVRRELNTSSMGTAMSELSARWKALDASERRVYVEMEETDRRRFREESRAADAIAREDQSARRSRYRHDDPSEELDPSKRSARRVVERDREAKEDKRRRRKRERQENADPEETERKRKAKEKKRRETAERQRAREEQERALRDRHDRLDRTQSVKADKRLEYLLQQSSIFAKLRMGSGKHDQEDDRRDQETRNKRSHRSKHGDADNKDDPDDLEDDADDADRHVFLTKQPSIIKFGTLKPYQLEGLNWMIHLAEKGLNGILADEMGLGKTLQSISILAYQFEYQKIQGPHLVCVPKSTLSNWMNELARWCPSLRAVRFHGKKEERAEMVERLFTHEAAAHDGRRPDRRIRNPDTNELEDDNSDNPRQWDVCVTTYEVCNSEKSTLSRFAWRYLIIDEAHRLKNETSIFSKTVREFRTAHRLLLTGTPLQNNLHELWALLNFLLPDIFSSSEQFDEWFNLEIDDDDAKKKMIDQLHKILGPFMIRRLKSDVAKGLPPKTETLVMVGMSSMQKRLYKKLLLRDIDSITAKNPGNKNRTAILNIVMQLRKCCGHPYLFEGVEDRNLDPLGEHLVENCGKLAIVDKLLRKLKDRGSRVLIFTQMTRVLDILEDFMVMRGHAYCRIDGNTDYDSRESAIATFNAPDSEKFCFILSTRAGGLGINLQTADTCILYDSDWNPQADLQAQDRCHRLGQKRPVNIYRLVSENTVEEKIVERAQQKLKLDAMVVQQGRLKDAGNNKVGKDEMMNAIRFGAENVFRSEDSTITDEDIDVILERGKAKTKELADKIKKAEKGDLLDFRLDGGVSAQTFEGVDYSDRELRNQLRLLAADSMGKRERKPPPTNYNPIIAPAKTMVVNNRKIKLPKSLRLPRMEDHQFYNRERLLELGKLEFQTYATLRQLGKVPPRETIDRAGTLLPPELAREKLDLLNEGFGDWTRSQYFAFVKACARRGRDDLVAIAADMDVPEERVRAYSEAFWRYASTELKRDEWERTRQNVERGEQRLARRRKLSALLSKFVSTFADPRRDMVFANKGTAHFRSEQDRSLLTSVDARGYGDWDAVRERLRDDVSLRFQHGALCLDRDAVAKRCDYRMRQMERELESRARRIKGERPANVSAATRTVEAVREIEEWERSAAEARAKGEEPPSTERLSEEARTVAAERAAERQGWADRIREIEIQVRDCKALAENTRRAILRGDQYVNYSNITLKAGGPHTQGDKGKSGQLEREIEREAKINPIILRVPECGVCLHCTDPKFARKLCLKRLEVRNKLLKDKSLMEGSAGGKKSKRAALSSSSRGTSKSSSDTASRVTKKRAAPGTSAARRKPRAVAPDGTVRGNPLGNKKMSVPDELLPEFCRRIGADGTAERMRIINNFGKDYPIASNRQVTMKFSELVTKERPACVAPPPKRPGRATHFFLRPRYYRLLPEESRPEGWETHAAEDEESYRRETEDKARALAKKDQQMKDLMSVATTTTDAGSLRSGDASVDAASLTTGGDAHADEETEEDDDEPPPPPRPPAKKKSKKTKK